MLLGEQVKSDEWEKSAQKKRLKIISPKEKTTCFYKSFFLLVRTSGLEPPTPCMSSKYSNQLSYALISNIGYDTIGCPLSQAFFEFFFSGERDGIICGTPIAPQGSYSTVLNLPALHDRIKSGNGRAAQDSEDQPGKSIPSGRKVWCNL